MAKFSPVALSINMDLTEKELFNIADYVADYYECEYDTAACNVAGIVKSELIRDIMAYPKFIETVTKMVRTYGYQFVDEPYDYMEYDFVLTLPGGVALENCVIEASQLIEDADRTSPEVEQALRIVRNAGYRVSN